MAYSDLIYQPGHPTNKRQGNASIFMPNAISGIVLRGDTVDYSGWANKFSGKFRTQVYVISGSGL